MGDHVHKTGEIMLSYRFMQMDMSGNRDGSNTLTAEQIATTAPNPFFGLPMMPPTLRVVPLKMTTRMHMLGAMYAPNNSVTLMAMTRYLDKKMRHVTFQGGMGSTRLGEFTTQTRGLGDTSLTALITLGHSEHVSWHATLGVSIPTGSVKRSGEVLTPMGATPKLRLPYPMQLGSGTYDALLGLTAAGSLDRWGWGGQWQSRLRLADNSESYRLGHTHSLSAWASYLVVPRLSLSTRLVYSNRDNVKGQDPLIVAPVQTADPHRQALKRLDLGLGANLILPSVQGHTQRIGLEFTRVLRERLAGPQMKMDWGITLGYQFNVR